MGTGSRHLGKDAVMIFPGAKSFVARLVVATLLVTLLAAGIGCASNDTSSTMPSSTASSVSAGTSTPATAVTSVPSSTTTTLPSLLSDWDRELARTAKTQRDVMAFLAQRGNNKDDPLLGLYYGLKARTQALTARKALADNNLELADTAMLDVYRSLNLARDVATGETAETVATARAVVETLGAPSDKPQEAAKSLEEFIEALAPLLDQASSVLSSTSTT